MVIETTLVLGICAIITAIGGAIAYITKAVKIIQQPHKEFEAQFEHVNKCLATDKDRIERLEKLVHENAEAIKFLIKLDLVTLKHLESGNETGLMRQTIKEVEEWLIHK